MKGWKIGEDGGDLLFLGSVLILSLLGLVFVYSASSYNAKITYGDEFYFLKKQLVGFALGLAGMAFTARFDYHKWKKTGVWALALSLVLLALVFVPGVGKSNYGATRWIGIGGITIQPSELAKYGFILFTSAYFAKNPSAVLTVKGVMTVLLAGGGICLLIIAEPNMSVTMCVGALMLGMLFLAGIPFKGMAIICIPVLLALPALIAAEPYRLNRLSAFLDPWASPKEEGYQLIQSLYALGNGKLFGTGLFRSRQKYRFLPFSESDFILSVIGEEIGFVGLIAFFALIGFIIARGFYIASRSKDYYGYLLGSGIILVYAVQTVLNALVVTGSIPPTGLPLPLVSSGNTSLIVTMSGMGIVYNLSREKKGEGRNNRGRPLHKI